MRVRPPWLIDVSALLAEPGSSREIHLVEPLDEITVGTSRTRGDAPIRLDAVLEAASGALSLRGRIEVEWIGQCRRCLEDVEGMARIEVDEVFATEHVEGETYPVDEEVVDLRPLAIDVIGLSLPLTPLCSVDCPGPLPERFPVLQESGEDAAAMADPRWAALDALRVEVAEVIDEP